MDILYQDKDLAVVVKPVGLESQAVVPAELEKLLGGIFYPVHRLDLNVGGVMVYARTKQAAAALSKAIQEGAMVKEYVAMVHGMPEEMGDWEDLLFKDSSKNKCYTPIASTHSYSPLLFIQLLAYLPGFIQRKCVLCLLRVEL